MLNAGFSEFAKFGYFIEEHFDRTYSTNVKGALFAFQKTLPLLSKGASVVLTGTIANMSACSSTKAALRNLVRG
jgi:NAD(P)-dependent dehydrogenase (short-subunit alcohol dehydrogenase family)